MQSRIEIEAGHRKSRAGEVCGSGGGGWGQTGDVFLRCTQLARIDRHARALDTERRNKGKEQFRQNAN